MVLRGRIKTSPRLILVRIVIKIPIVKSAKVGFVLIEEHPRAIHSLTRLFWVAFLRQSFKWLQAASANVTERHAKSGKGEESARCR